MVPAELSAVVLVVLVYWAIAMLAKAAVKRKDKCMLRTEYWKRCCGKAVVVEKRTIDSESAETKDGTIRERTQFLARVVMDVKNG